MNVLSLFDGMSCGQIALNRAGIKYDNYFASEINKYAIKITQKNYPNTIQIGDVENIKVKELPKIDLLIGGSPCQGFSFAGKQLNFGDPRSKLFFEFVRLLKETKPKYFLLENVIMKKEYQNIITKYLEAEPILINSSLVSAQNRRRLYWTNINGIEQPKDKGIILRDILQGGEKIGAIRGRYINKNKGQTKQKIEIRKDNKSNSLTTVQKDNIVIRPCVPHFYKNSSICHHAANAIDIKGNQSIKRVYADSGKSPTLTTMQGGHREPKILTSPDGLKYRKLSPLECERLQTIPDNYTAGVSNSQRYKMLGNGWTVDVISHIFSYLKQ